MKGAQTYPSLSVRHTIRSPHIAALLAVLAFLALSPRDHAQKLAGPTETQDQQARREDGASAPSNRTADAAESAAPKSPDSGSGSVNQPPAGPAIAAPANADLDPDEEDDESDAEIPSGASLSANVAADGAATIYFNVIGAESEVQDWNGAFREAFGCPLKRESSTKRYLNFGSKACALVPRRQGLQFQGQIRLTPLFDALRSVGVNRLTVFITEAGGIPLACSPRPQGRLQTFNTTSCEYSVLLTPDPASPAQSRPAPKDATVWLPASSLPSVDLSYGVGAAKILRGFAVLAIALVLPILATLWLRRKAIFAAEKIAAEFKTSGESGQSAHRHDDRAGIWFGYWKSLSWIITAGLILWWAASDAVNLGLIVKLLFAVGGPAKADWMIRLINHIAVWIPPLVMAALCQVLSHPVQIRVRGLAWTRREVLEQSIWSLAAGWLPILFFLTGLEEIVRGDQRIGITWFMVAFFGRAFAARKSMAAQGLTPHALTAGELRDHIFALAEKLKVKLTQVFVVATGKARMANAFARSGNSILLTDTLLENLNRREVDAVIAHELAHLKHGHPGKLGMAWIGGLVATIAAMSSLPSIGPLNHLLRYSVAFLLPSVFVYFFSRRFEYTADRTAVKLTGDAEAQITSLAKLNRMNLMPMEWGRVQGKFLTHPSTFRRAVAIARAAGISEAMVPEILQQPFREPVQEVAEHLPPVVPPSRESSPAQTGPGSAPWGGSIRGDLRPDEKSSSVGVATLEEAVPAAEKPKDHVAPAPDAEAPSQTYALPANVANQEKVFSTTVKQRIAFRNAWIFIATLSVPPALVALVARDPHMLGKAFLGLLMAGWALTIAVSLTVTNNLPSWQSKALRGRLRQKLEKAGVDPVAWGGRYVGFSPHAGPRSYEGLLVWDIGFLFVYPDRICYCGEGTQFSLTRDQVTSAQLARGSAAWISADCAYISWQVGSRSGTFNLRPGDARSVVEAGKMSRQLVERLHTWREKPAPRRDVPPVLAGLGAPPTGKVTTASSKLLKKVKNVLGTTFLLGFVAWGVSVLCGFPAFGIVMPLSYLTLLSAPAATRALLGVSFLTLMRNFGMGWYMILTAWTVYWTVVIPTFFSRDPVLRKDSSAPSS
jgi:Zn-dependent protease with chaperone function